MRLCYAYLCDETATVYYKGSWCGFHANRRFGAVIGTLSKTSATRQAEAAAPSVRPQERDSGLAENPFPPAGVPAPFFDDALVALLDERGWDELDLELALISHLEGDLDLPKGTPS
jgi:hypothetical protein